MSGLSAAIDIQRHVAPRDWPAAIAALPEPERPIADEYLRGIAARTRVVRLARRADPATSHAAAEMVTAIGSRQDHIGRIVRAVRAHPGRTSAELAPLAELDRVEAARRTADAANQGLIERGSARVCRVKGTKAITWWPVPTAAQRECLQGAA